MRLTEIQLKTFRSYVNVSLSLNAFRVLISGVNGSGKTSIRDAIAWVLTGSTPDMTGKGSGGELLVPTMAGAHDATASVVLDGAMRVERVWAGSGQQLRVTNWTGNLTDQQQALYTHLKANETLIHVLCDARAFLRLDHADAKGLLLGLMNVLVQAPVGPGNSLVPHTLDQLDAAYAQAFEDRKIAKRRVLQANVPPEPVSAVTYKPVAEYEARLVQLRAELATMEREIGGACGRREAETARLKACDRLVQAELSPQAVTHLEAAIADTKSLLAALSDTTEAGVHSPERVRFLKGRIEALRTHNPEQGCVLDSGVPCKTPINAFAKQGAEYEAELAAMPPEAPPVSERGRLTSRLKEDEAKLTRHTEAVAFNKTLAAEKAGIEQEIAALPDISTQEQAIAEKRKYIAHGEGITADAKRYVASVEAWEAAKQVRQQAEAEVARLEHLVDTLGPNGVRVQALETALTTFLAQVNPYLAPFGWTLRFSVQPWGAFVNDRPVQTYSASERYRIGVALQLAIAQASGVSFAVVDELDILDGEGNKKLGALLYNSPVEQIIILRTREITSPLPKMPGVLAYRLGSSEGRSIVTERVEGTGVAA